MKFLVVIILIMGGAYFYNQSKSDGGHTGGASLENPKSNIEKAISNIYILNKERNANLRKVQSVEVDIRETNTFRINYVKEMAKAYKSSKGDDKKAIKFIKNNMVEWYKNEVNYMAGVGKNGNIIYQFTGATETGNCCLMRLRQDSVA